MDWSQVDSQISVQQRALDQWALNRAGSTVTLERLYGDLREACLGRVGLAADKVKKVHKKKTENIGNVAASIAATIGPQINSKRFPEDFIDGAPLDINFQVSRGLVRKIEHHPMLDEIDLVLSGENGRVIYEGASPHAQAETIVRAVLWGRTEFQLTSNQAAMHRALTEFISWGSELNAGIVQAISDSALGTGYEEQLRLEVFRRLGVEPIACEVRLPSTIVVRA